MREDEIRALLPRILVAYGIRENFPIEARRGPQAVRGERAHAEFPTPGGHLDRARIVYQVPLHRETLYHEVAHVKLKCLEHPAYLPNARVPQSAGYFYIMSEEYFARLLVDAMFPEVSSALMSAEVENLHPIARYRVGAESTPPWGTPDWLEGAVVVVRMIQNERVCRVSANLSRFRSEYSDRILQYSSSSLSDLIARIGQGFLSLPYLPNPLRSFDATERNAIHDVTMGWVDAALRGMFDILASDNYTIDC